MDNLIDTIALHFDLNELCDKHDINPATVVKWMVDEGYINLEDYND